MSDRSDIISLHVIGELADRQTYCKAIPPDEDTSDPFIVAAMEYLCATNGARFVGIVRTRKGETGKLEPVKSSFVEPMSPRDEEILEGIVCRIICDESTSGFIETPDAAERAIESIEFLEREGLEVGGESA